MDKQQKLKIVLPILIIIMVFVWGSVIAGSGSKEKKGKNNNLGEGSVSQGGNLDLITLTHSNERKKARTSYADWGRSPFMLFEGPKASVLEGIMWDARNPKAIINGNIVGIGEQVGSGVVVDILRDSVIIKIGTIEKRYSLGQ